MAWYHVISDVFKLLKHTVHIHRVSTSIFNNHMAPLSCRLEMVVVLVSSNYVSYVFGKRHHYGASRLWIGGKGRLPAPESQLITILHTACCLQKTPTYLCFFNGFNKGDCSMFSSQTWNQGIKDYLSPWYTDDTQFGHFRINDEGMTSSLTLSTGTYMPMGTGPYMPIK